MKNFTQVPNEIFEKSQLTNQARLLYCLLLRRCQSDEWCYPSQRGIGECLSLDPRSIRTYIRELESAGLIFTKRTGFGRPNTYRVSKQLVHYEKNGSFNIGSVVPLYEGNPLPPKNTYKRRKYNNKILEIRKELANKLSIK